MRIGGDRFPDPEAYFNRVGQTQGAPETPHVKRPEDSPHRPEERAASGPAEETVVLSSGGREVLRAQKLAESAPEIREEKVAELKAAIEEGRYQVDAEKLADSLLRDPLLNILR
ncbi:MAG: flagellar biosynthesis anti-sigma factor FlgM [Candidatus Tectomicrobia bacterium]|nr:flagellar biosynthesis anti-sigma factor FlgM [Candidatus Tectomicrobia bacterium]